MIYLYLNNVNELLCRPSVRIHTPTHVTLLYVAYQVCHLSSIVCTLLLSVSRGAHCDVSVLHASLACLLYVWDYRYSIKSDDYIIIK